MITTKFTFPYPDRFLLAAGLDPSRCVLFDIETTGFRASSSHLYLIGAAVRTASEGSGEPLWNLTQWLSEKPQQEASLLRAFSDALPPDAILVHFNGNRFDLPYLEEKYSRYGIPSPLAGLQSEDLYTSYRGLRSFLGMEHMKLTSIEQFLRLRREDRYDGGKLIPVYRSYCGCQSPELLELLLLHNREDVEGTLRITSMQSYLSLREAAGRGTLGPVSISEKDGMVFFSFGLPLPVPSPVRRALRFADSAASDPDRAAYGAVMARPDTTAPVGVHPLSPKPPVLLLSEDRGQLRVPLWQGTLRYYFEDYRNYCYLPLEDEAIHRSVAQFVDKERRQPATRENCYIRREGLFLPQPGPVCDPALRLGCDDRACWLPWGDETVQDPEKVRQYVCAVIADAFSS